MLLPLTRPRVEASTVLMVPEPSGSVRHGIDDAERADIHRLAVVVEEIDLDLIFAADVGCRRARRVAL